MTQSAVSGDVPEPDDAEPPIALSDSPSNSEDEVDQLVLSRLAQEGGVKFLDVLLAKAVPLDDLGSPDTLKFVNGPLGTFYKCQVDSRRNGAKRVVKSLNHFANAMSTS